MDRKNKINIVITAVVAVLFLFANIYAVRKIFNYATEVYLYDKLLVAFQVGGPAALENELEKVLSEDKLRYELAIAGNFKKNLNNLKDPAKFLKDASSKQKAKINQLRNLRSAVFVLLLLIFILKIIINKRNKNRIIHRLDVT